MPAKSGGSSSGRSASRRLLKELEDWREDSKDETGIERLGPVEDEDLLSWEAVINGRGIPGGYEGELSSPFPALLDRWAP
jgi:peroxin-4